MIQLKCKYCELDFTKIEGEYNRQIKQGRINFFCSLSCGTKHQRKIEYNRAVEKYNLAPNKCIECYNSLSYDQKNNITCSHECGGKHANKIGDYSNRNKHGKYKIKPCKICNNPTKKTFCSKTCESQFRRNETYQKLKNGSYIGNCTSQNSIRKALIQIKGHQCEDCKNTVWKTEPINLTLHHIDGDAFNNKIDNLQLLCWNCHSMTHNYGNKKSRKSSRVHRYNNS